MRREQIKHCPVCERETLASHVEAWREFQIWRCTECELQFSDPMVHAEAMYGAGYGNPESQLAQETGFSEHLKHGASLAHLDDVRPFLTPLERAALRSIVARVPKGAVALDLGCGSGRFLMALAQSGYRAHGMDVAGPPLEMLRRHGHRISHGSIDDVPAEWPEPQVVSCFEVLEHVADPVGFLRKVRQRFPRAVLVLSVPLPWNERCDRLLWYEPVADYPPNHLTRWSRKSLARAIAGGSYRARIETVHVTGEHIRAPSQALPWVVRRVAALVPSRHEARAAEHTACGDIAGSTWKKHFYRAVCSPYVWWLRARGNSAYAYLAVAQPID